MSIGRMSVLEIFSNPFDLEIIIDQGKDEGKFGMAICRGPGHRFKPIVSTDFVFPTSDNAIEYTSGLLTGIYDNCEKELTDSTNVTSKILNPEGRKVDGLIVLNKSIITYVLEELRQKKTASTYVPGWIKVIRTPDGEAPLLVRQAWQGLTLPCNPILGFPDNGAEYKAVSREKLEHNRIGFSVSQEMAVAILEQRNPAAALWWKNNGYPLPDQYFGFDEGEATILHNVTRQNTIEVKDEMRGDPDR